MTHGERRGLDGLDYIEFLSLLNSATRPTSYFEIGTNYGASLSQFSCDAVCVDPEFVLEGSRLGKRRRALLFQMSSDEFFHDYDLSLYFPGGLDIAFLDGMHRFEFLLRDFYNTERHCHSRSIILLHDCLPQNARMAERTHRFDEAEDASTQASWTGDVWKLLPILRKYRPDLRIHVLDCPPTGLVAVTNLSRESNVLRDSYYGIIDEFSSLDLKSVGVENLMLQFPFLPSRLIGTPDMIGTILSVR